jgi:hypothetical protein
MAIAPDSTKPLVTQFNEFRAHIAEIEADIANGVGSGPGTGEEIPGPTYPPQVLLVGITETQLTIPEGANRALVTVTVGVARIGLGDAATAPEYPVSDGVGVAGGELSALRLIRSGTADATVRVDYWQVLDTRAQALADIAEAKTDLTASVGTLLTDALADLGQAQANIPNQVATALAPVAPALADIAQSQATLEAATATALGTVGVSPAQIYDEGAALGGASDGTYAAQFQPSGLFQRLKRVAGAWVNSGSALMTQLGLQLRLGGVNVRDYGALGNGVTNDSAAFAAAELAAFNAGKWIRVPDGNYLLNSEFIVRVNVRLEDGATLTAGAVMPAVIGTDGDVLYKNKRIVGGRVDARNLAVRGVFLRYGQYSKIIGTEVESPNLYHYQVGMLGSPVPSYEISVNDVRGDRSRGTTYEQQNDGSIVLLVENCTDSHFSDNILIGADIGILDRNGGNNHYHLQHAWARMNENRMLECFVVESAKTRWTQCTADTALLNGWHVKNWHTVIENSMVFNNGQGAPETVQGVAYPGMTGIKFDSGLSYASVTNVNFQGQSTRYIDKDIDAPGMQYLSVTGKHSQYVTNMYSTDYVQASLSQGYVKRFFLNNLSAWWINIKAVTGEFEIFARSSVNGSFLRTAISILRDASEIQLNNQITRFRSTDPALNLDLYLEQANKRRWGLTLTPDTGVGNGGGELRVSSYDNAGNYIGDILRAYRDVSDIDFRTTNTRFSVQDDAADLNLYLQRGSSRRWGLGLGTESGALGGHFGINRYSKAGAYLSTPLTVRGDTGEVQVTEGLRVNLISISNGTVASEILQNVTTTDAILDISPKPPTGTAQALVRIGRNLTTTGNSGLQIAKGDGTSTVNHQLLGNNSTSYLSAAGGSLAVGGTSVNGGKLHLYGDFKQSSGVMKPAVFTKATLPSASASGSGAQSLVSDPAASKGPQVYSNGTAWLYTRDDSAV